MEHRNGQREQHEPASTRGGGRRPGARAVSETSWRARGLVVLLAVGVVELASGFAPTQLGNAMQARRRLSGHHLARLQKGRPVPARWGLRGYMSYLRRGEGLNTKSSGSKEDVDMQEGAPDDIEDNGFDPFFVLSEGMLHAEPTAMQSWPPPMPNLAEFEEKMRKAEEERTAAFRPDRKLMESALAEERADWERSWMRAKPQETIAQQGLRRDRWVPLDIPMSSDGIQEMLKNPYVQLVLSDPEQRNYWLYATGRTIFFFGSSVLSALLQINIEPDWRPWVFGTNYRREVSAALKRIAMSGESKESGEFASKTKIPSIERVFRLFGSVFELYRRDCRCLLRRSLCALRITPDQCGWSAVMPSFRVLTCLCRRSNIAFGIYRYPYDASLRHRQFNPLYVRERFLNTFAESVKTGARRAMGEMGKREMRQKILLREAQAYGGVVLVEDPLKEPEDLFNDRYLLGNVSFYPEYYLQNFHWQTDGWLSMRSARSYEYTTESLFSGCQDAMQRQSLVSISEFVALRRGIVEEKDITLLEVAAGTGRQHTFLKDNWPEMKTVCSDLSPFYLQEARENMEYFAEYTKSVTGRDIRFPEYVHAKAEDLPFDDNSFDIITCTYLFHEIPFDVRKAVAREMFRAVKPGGICVITDSFQRCDRLARPQLQCWPAHLTHGRVLCAAR
jgi:ubiquinone/menaquinone biosynthesis C-methylase UbiE